MKKKISDKEVDDFLGRYSKLLDRTMRIMNRNGNSSSNEMEDDRLNDDEKLLYERLSDVHYLLKNVEHANNADKEKSVSRLVMRLHDSATGGQSSRRLWIYSLSSAAVVFVLLGISFLLFFKGENRLPAGEQGVSVPTLIIANRNIVLPENSNRISSADYVLNESANASSIQNKAERKEGVKIGISKWQQLIVPQGYTYTVALSDGSEVQLNGGSELRYPSKFEDSVRQVYLKGEAFFNVSKGVCPFIVSSGPVNLKVYGTSFNVKNIDGERIKTVLLEGVVGVKVSGKEEVVMHPNDLVTVYSTNRTITQMRVNPEDYVLWKEGFFNYKETLLTEILTDIENRYHICFIDKSVVSDIRLSFFSKIEEKENAVLRVIELSTGIRFKKEGGGIYSIKR